MRSREGSTAYGDIPGLVAGAPVPASSRRGSDFADLCRIVKQAGLLEPRPWRYAGRIAVLLSFLGAGWAAFVLVGNSWWQLAVAVFLAIMFTQVAFLGHDAGHRQISRSRRICHILGVLHGNLGIGLSYGWWVTKHNRHHAHPNTEGADPDVNMKVLAFTPAQARASRGLLRMIFRCQAYLFFPMLLAEALSLHISSIGKLVGRQDSQGRVVEATLLVAHFAGYLAVVFVVLPPVKAIVFIVIQQGLFGLYLGLSFAPNHKGMPILDAADQSDFLRRQVLTSRNVRGGRITDLALGGLNYQIEHHLFPSMPRPNLRHAQPLIREFCRERGVPYAEASLAGSYAMALRHLHAMGGMASSSPAKPTLLPAER